MDTNAKMADIPNISAVKYAKYGTTKTKTGARIFTRFVNLLQLDQSLWVFYRPGQNGDNKGKSHPNESAAECDDKK